MNKSTIEGNKIMNLEALEKGLAVEKKYDIVKTPINVGDVICISEGSYGGGSWLNRGIVTDLLGKGVQYVDLRSKEMRKVLGYNTKALVITKNYSSDEIHAFELMAKEVLKKEEEKKLAAINHYYLFMIEDKNETIIIPHRESGTFCKEVFKKVIEKMKKKYNKSKVYVWTKNKEFIYINDVKTTKVRTLKNDILSHRDYTKIVIKNNEYEIYKDEKKRSGFNWITYEIKDYFESKNIKWKDEQK